VSTHPIPIRQLWPGFVLSVLLLLAIYLVQFDDGTISRTGLFLHELMHDGRHVLGVPCH
jgi:hypothetical protein